ncbi:MAG: methyltransferase domain-containing protein [Acidimicrobiales bacterium]|nr:methyltransferase domain-containing protein [Acidimicrobiales bacterium]
MINRCPACEGTRRESVFQMRGVPVFCNVLFTSRQDAEAAALGDIDLVVCPDCSLLYNAAFDDQIVDYSPAYENSLHHSAVFRDFVEGLADRLISTYGIRDADIVEIGAGGGLFLNLLCEKGANRGFGYDPSHDPQRYQSHPLVTVVAEPYPETLDHAAKLVCSQHVLEHLTDPRTLVSTVRRSLEDLPEAVVYHEVPDATHMVEQVAIWDLIYEHVSYFSATSLAQLHRSCGFEVLETRTDFGGQFLSIEAVPGSVSTEVVDPTADLERARSFGSDAAARISEWSDRLSELVSDGPTVIWGAGSKGVQFLNAVDGADAVVAAVDLNPHKWGRFVPGGGHPVIGPDSLVELAPSHVIAMNPIYAQEIADQLSDLGLAARVHSM